MSAGTIFSSPWDKLDGETWFEGGFEGEGGTKALVWEGDPAERKVLSVLIKMMQKL